ncbi:hypothetical protein KAT92_04665 [Candidatus Babeliales bacterium]|nr:hypothetical protein [Candidatus Babeliales bacterium]
MMRLIFRAGVFAFFATSLLAGNSTSSIVEQIKQAINQELDFVATSSHDRRVVRKKVSSRVKQEINEQVYSKLKNHAKDSVYSNDSIYDLSDEPIPFIYKVPAWPRQAQFFLKKDQVALDMQADFASQAYGSSGSTMDISNIVFQQEPIYIKDILITSKLIEQGVAVFPTGVTKYKFLDTLKDQLLTFNASTNQQQAALSYVRHFHRGDISLGLQVPFVRRVNSVRLSSKLSQATKESLNTNNPDFYKLYPDGLIDFFKDILLKKNIEFNEHDTEIGVGDIEVFANYEIMTTHAERFIVGGRMLFPTSKRRDVYKLWDPEIGNGGHVELSAFGSLLFGYSRWFNPHVFTQVTYSVPARLMRRVPRRRAKEDIEDITLAHTKFGDDFIPYGNYVNYSGSGINGPAFSELDTTVRRFSDTVKRTKINRGSELRVRLGNTIENIFTERMFLDLFYDFYAKGRDSNGFCQIGDPYDPSILTKNSFEVAYRLGLDLSCQFDDFWRLRVGAMYALAGRNTLREFSITGALSLEF